MKKVMYGCAAAVVMSLFAGCASVQTTTPADLSGQKIATSGKTVAHINAQNSGFYFLKWPIATGSTTSVGMTSWFDEDSVNVPSTVKLVTNKAKEMKADTVDNLQSERGGMMIPFPFPFLFYWNTTNVSGNALQ